MRKILDFLSDLDKNNNRDWFNTNKKRYLEVKDIFEDFTAQLIEEIREFDPSIANVSVKDSTYRIYRDTRFRKDKTPYKTHIGAYICHNGKKSGYAGYYFHIEPKQTHGGGFGIGNLLSSGIYCAEPKTLKSIREDIYAYGNQFESAINKANTFELNKSNSLKNTPKGFPKDSKYDELLKLKDFYLDKNISAEFLLDKDLAKRAAGEFAKTKEFIDFINKAVRFSFEEK